MLAVWGLPAGAAAAAGAGADEEDEEDASAICAEAALRARVPGRTATGEAGLGAAGGSAKMWCDD